MGTHGSHFPSQSFLPSLRPAPALSPPGPAVHSSPWALRSTSPSSFCIPSADELLPSPPRSYGQSLSQPLCPRMPLL